MILVCITLPLYQLFVLKYVALLLKFFSSFFHDVKIKSKLFSMAYAVMNDLAPASSPTSFFSVHFNFVIFLQKSKLIPSLGICNYLWTSTFPLIFFLRERETSICCFTYACIHWLILVCVLTSIGSCNLGVLDEALTN